MAKMRDLLRPKQTIDPAEMALAESRTAARLAELFAPAAGARATVEPAPGASEARRPEADAAVGRPGGPLASSRPPIVVEPSTERVSIAVDVHPPERVPVIVEAWDAGPALAPDTSLPADGTVAHEPVGDQPAAHEFVAFLEAATAAGEVGSDPLPLAAGEPERPAGIEPQAPLRRVAPRPSGAVALAGAAVPARRRAVARRTPAQPTRARSAVVSCPYCAVLLDPPPTGGKRCDRCRQPIVVKHVDGRAVYLTRAAVEVFEAERRRLASAARFTRERDRWLRLAAAAGAPEVRVARLTAARLTEDVVAAARTLYLATAERSFAAAKREHRWVDAGRIGRAHALALQRVAGSGLPPPDEAVTTHRDAVAAELRGLTEVARNAELVAAGCCDACRAEAGVTVRIAAELRAPRLPHAGCPKGLCRCRWDLAAADRTTVRRYLRHR